MASDRAANPNWTASIPCETGPVKPELTIPAWMSEVVPIREEASFYHRVSITTAEASTTNPCCFQVQLRAIRQDLAAETDRPLRWVGRETDLHSSLEWVQTDHSKNRPVVRLRKGPVIQPCGRGEAASTIHLCIGREEVQPIRKKRKEFRVRTD